MTVLTITARCYPVGRELSMTLGFRWLSTGSVPPVLATEHLYQAVLGSVITISSAGTRRERWTPQNPLTPIPGKER